MEEDTAAATPVEQQDYFQNEINILVNKITDMKGITTWDVKGIHRIRDNLTKFEATSSTEEKEMIACHKSLTEGIRRYEDMKLLLNYLKSTLEHYEKKLQAPHKNKMSLREVKSILQEQINIPEHVDTTNAHISEIRTALAALMTQLNLQKNS